MLHEVLAHERHRERHVPGCRGLDDLAANEHPAVRVGAGGRFSHTPRDRGGGGCGIVFSHGQKIVQRGLGESGKRRLDHRLPILPDRRRRPTAHVLHVYGHGLCDVAPPLSPGVVSDELDEMRIAAGVCSGLRERSVFDRKPRGLDGLPERSRDISSRDARKLLCLGTTQERDALAVQKIEHSRRDVREQETDILPLANHVLHVCSNDSHVVT